MRRTLSLGYQTLPGLPPPDLVRIAAELGCSGVSISAALSSMSKGQASLLDDRDMRRATAQAFRETGLSFDLVEGVGVMPDVDLDRARETLEVMRELGARRFNLSFWVADEAQSEAIMDGFWRIGRDLQMRITVEFVRRSRLKSLAAAAALATAGRYPGLQILVDALHLARADEMPADVAALDPSLIGFCQICDGPIIPYPGDEAYAAESQERQVPGEGSLPLRDLLLALPPEVVVAVEVPKRSWAEAGMAPLERARRAVEGARRLVEDTP